MESLIIRSVGKSFHELHYNFLNVWVWEGLVCIYKARMSKERKMLEVRVAKKRFLGLSYRLNELRVVLGTRH